MKEVAFIYLDILLLAIGIEATQYAADESILCMRGGDAALPKLIWDLFQS